VIGGNVTLLFDTQPMAVFYTFG